jgi:hypothetical protein
VSKRNGVFISSWFRGYVSRRTYTLPHRLSIPNSSHRLICKTKTNINGEDMSNPEIKWITRGN